MSDERIKKSSGGNRVNRAMQDRPVTSNREVSEDEFMMEAHHNAPAREEEKLSDTADFMEQQAKASGSRIDMGDGTREIGEHREGRFDLA